MANFASDPYLVEYPLISIGFSDVLPCTVSVEVILAGFSEISSLESNDLSD